MNTIAHRRFYLVVRTIAAYFSLACIGFCCALGQQADTTVAAEVRVANIVVLPPRTIEFDFVLVNRSLPQSPTEWRFWANGTFVLNLRGIAMQNATLELDSTALSLETLSPSQLLLTQRRLRYEIRTLIQEQEQRLVIAVLGGDSVEHTQTCLPASSLLIGRFRLVLQQDIQNPNSVRFAWAAPLVRFQANAFKLAQPQTINGKDYRRNDNCEMNTQFSVEEPQIEQAPNLVSSGLQAEYRGDKRILIRWKTAEERIGRRTNAGFLLLRQSFFAERSSNDTLPRTFDTIATFRQNSQLRVRGARNGAEYEYRDSIPTRGKIYVYRLAFADATIRPAQAFQVLLQMDTVQVPVPNAVIAEASVSPNPVADNSVLAYTLLDRAIVTSQIIDVAGRVLLELERGVEHPRGSVWLPVPSDALPHQGAIFLVLKALPANDIAVERSQVTLKLQISR